MRELTTHSLGWSTGGMGLGRSAFAPHLPLTQVAEPNGVYFAYARPLRIPTQAWDLP